MVTVRHRFESPDTTQTLAEALSEYLAANPLLKRESDLQSPEARQFFRSHDVVHVVYGCGTSLLDESIVKLSSIFGTTGGIRVLRGYAPHETLDIYRKLPVLGSLHAFLAAPYMILRTVWRCMAQSKRWPWDQYDAFLNVPLREVRAQFRIKVAHERGAA
ncbi:MAG: hypothetical protein KIT60_12240 [Burkholderiaceae bacterium]|nr:hypothetical protein [Burkholderiaceae bacterium]